VIIHDGPAQMIVTGYEFGGPQPPGWYPMWLLHNDDPVNEIYFDIHQNIFNGAGSPNFVLPPGAQITLDASRTFWARTADGTTANLHLVPTSTYGASGTAAVAGG